MRSGDTPVSIPNTMVKTWAADDTMLETAWESRWMPDLYGGVAQLGEHLPCKQGVKSSNLSISIRDWHRSSKTKGFLTRVQARYKNKTEWTFCFCNVPWKPHIERSDTNLPIEREEDKYQDIRGVTRKCNQQTKNKQLFVNTEPGIQRYVSETESVPAGEVVWLS